MGVSQCRTADGTAAQRAGWTVGDLLYDRVRLLRVANCLGSRIRPDISVADEAYQQVRMEVNDDGRRRPNSDRG